LIWVLFIIVVVAHNPSSTHCRAVVQYSFKSDIWSLGCVLYELTTLKHAFAANNIGALVLKIIRGKYPPIPAHYSGALRDLVAQTLQQDPDERPTVEQILRSDAVRPHIGELLGETVRAREFSHTVLHAAVHPLNTAGIPVLSTAGIPVPAGQNAVPDQSV
jgi:serine/threonine protein kinase